ncbi:MAG: histidine kinase N-terminal 7TM domain-containing protein [Candidatus ainarchaeum sp.]|nr:histidine kinase N-terminal 7TM domain-containing protein [Candidatus ainarchaeum sp.]
MCFTPAVSLSIAIFEALVATFILLYFKKSTLHKSLVVFLYVLGFYQLTEFFLCTTSNPFLWAKLGFITYSFLPALGLYYALDYLRKKIYLIPIFVIPVATSIFVLINSNFISLAACGSFFVTTRNMFMGHWIGAVYLVYYFGFICLIAIFLILHAIKKKGVKRQLDIIVLLALVLSLFPPIILIFILPSLKIMFPSIYCEFAVLFAFAALWGFYLDFKSQSQKKNK